MVDHMRYAGAHVIRKENVAEHSYYVTIMADLLAEDIEEHYENISINRLNILRMALYHDAEEAYTGDMITPVKNKSSQLKQAWETLCVQMTKEGLAIDFPGHKHIQKYILHVHEDYEEHKYSKLENLIVKFADMAQSVVYLLREVQFGNTHVIPILMNVVRDVERKFKNVKPLNTYAKTLSIYAESIPVSRENVCVSSGSAVQQMSAK